MGVVEHGPLTVSRLGELMRLDSGTLSPLLKRMESAGLVGRARDPEDERRVLVSATAAGRERLAGLGDLPHQIAVRSGLTRAGAASTSTTRSGRSDRAARRPRLTGDAQTASRGSARGAGSRRCG